MFPEFIRIRSVSWISEQNVVSSETRSLIELTRTLPGHRFQGRFNVQVRPWEVRQARAWFYALQVDDANVTYTDVDWMTDVTGVEVDSDTDAGESTIPVNSSNDIELGMMLNFADHSKLYTVIAKGAGVITVFPELHADVTLGESVILDDPTATLEMPAELKRSATLESQLDREPSSINLRMVEVRR